MSRIALTTPDGEVFCPNDTNLDGRMFGITRRIGVVTFDPFENGVDHFDILIAPKSRRGKSEAPPLRIRVVAPGLRTDITDELNHKGILDTFTEQMSSVQVEQRQRVAEEVHKSQKAIQGSGCALLLAALFLTFASLALAL